MACSSVRGGDCRTPLLSGPGLGLGRPPPSVTRPPPVTHPLRAEAGPGSPSVVSGKHSAFLVSKAGTLVPLRLGPREGAPFWAPELLTVLVASSPRGWALACFESRSTGGGKEELPGTAAPAVVICVWDGRTADLVTRISFGCSPSDVSEVDYHCASGSSSITTSVPLVEGGKQQQAGGAGGVLLVKWKDCDYFAEYAAPQLRGVRGPHSPARTRRPALAGPHSPTEIQLADFRSILQDNQ